MLSLDSSLFLFLASIFLTLARYFLLSGGMYYFFDKRGNPWRPRWMHAVTAQIPSRLQLIHEIKWGVWSSLFIGTLSWLATLAVLAGRTRVYMDLGQYGLFYAVFSFFLLALFHDGYFFWSHYWLHRLPSLYRRVHAVHHFSRHPSPFADLTFHPLEALIQGAFVPLMLWIVPLHPVVIFSYLGFVSVMNAIGHTGFELFPEWMKERPMLKYLSSPGNHAQHHLNPQVHLGLYFDCWDRWMGSHSRT